MVKFTLLLLAVCLSFSSVATEHLPQDVSGQTNEESATLFFYRLKQRVFDIDPPVFDIVVDGLSDLEEKNEGPVVKAFQANLDNYLKLAALFGKLDVFGKEFGEKLVKYIKDDKVLTGYQLHLITKTVSSYHHVSAKTLQYASHYAPGKKKDNDQFIDLEDLAKTKENLIWLSARMDMYQNLLNAYDVFYKKEGKLRRILKHTFRISDSTRQMGEELKDMVKYSLGKKGRKDLQKKTKVYEEYKGKLGELADDDAELALLVNKINGNRSYKNILDGKKVKLKAYRFIDFFPDMLNGIVNTLSGFFGNIAGSMKFRKGYLWENDKMAAEFKAQLKPLDIIYEKTPFILTDKFIPGHFGHAALWLGTEKELKEIGMWDHPSIQKYHDRIRLGYSLVEALRPGVSMNTMEGFMNIDHIAIMRVKDVMNDALEIPDIYTRALQNMGKDYDFNFDVTTPDKIVCSELIYQAFGKLRFPVKYRLGRPTIEPDLVAEVNYYDNSPLEFLSYIETTSREKIHRYKEPVLGERLGFVVNQDRSTEDDISYDRKKKKCRTVLKPKKRLFSKKIKYKRKRVCSYVLEREVYVEPELLANGQDIP